MIFKKISFITYCIFCVKTRIVSLNKPFVPPENFTIMVEIAFIMILSKYQNNDDLPNFDPNNLSEAMIKHYIDIIKQKYIIYWQHTILHSKKLRFYNIFKHDYKISSYLDLTRNSTNRRDLVKRRTSNQKLMIETGRHDHTPHNDRFCPLFVTLK